MKALTRTSRRLLIALTALSLVASPVTAHAVAGCKSDGVHASSNSDCCCGRACRCAHCPGVSSAGRAPVPVPTIPEDGRVVVKIQPQSSFVCMSCFAASAHVVECTPGSFAAANFSANLSSSLIAMHTCLRV